MRTTADVLEYAHHFSSGTIGYLVLAPTMDRIYNVVMYLLSQFVFLSIILGAQGALDILKMHNMLPKHLQTMLMCIASRFKILNIFFIPATSGFQSLDFHVQSNYLVVLFILRWQHM